MSVDMDAGATPANTSTSLGSTESCARINKNDMLDADEDSIDGLQVDVTATNIPPSTGMVAFGYTISYNEANLTLMTSDHAYLLASNPGSSLFNAGQPTPDTNGDGTWSAAAADIGSGSPESGSGVLSRLVVAADPTAATGVYTLALSGAAHIDAANVTYGADQTNDGSVAVNTECPGLIQQADVEVSGVTVSAPAAASAGTMFTVNASATLHNNGPFEPVNADVAYDLRVPAGCTTIEPTSGTVQDVSLALSASVAVPGGWSWTITCNTPGSQRFTLDVSIAVDAVAVVDPVTGNNSLSGSAATNVTAESDLAVTAVTINAPPSMTVSTATYITARATMHNQGSFGPTDARITLTMTLAPNCVAMGNPLTQTVSGISLPVSASVDSPTTATMGNWFVRCESLGPALFTVNATLQVDQLNVTDPAAANDTGSAQAQMQILLPVCGPDPNPAGFPVADPHPTFLTLLSQLASMAPNSPQPPPAEQTTPINCNLALNLSDGKGAPIDDCEVSTLAAPRPCSIAIDAGIDQVAGSPPNTPSARLLPVAVSFLPPTFDLANDTAIPNGSINGNGSFRIRTDGGLGANGIGCVIDAVFPVTPALEGGVLPNVADSDLNAALNDPSVWPNDLNAERAAVESALTLAPSQPPLPPVTLWSRSIVPMNIPGLSALTLNVLTWRIDDPVLMSITGALWVTIAFPGDAVNPDPAGPSGGNPDFDEQPRLPLATCAPFGIHLEFAGMVAGAVARQCMSPADPMVFALLDPDAVNYTGDDGPRSDTSPCSVDADMDGLTANEETYYGSNPLDSDSDDDTLADGVDNCRMAPNPDQTNFDGDGEGDTCDPDVDGDGAANAADLCAWTTPGDAADASGCSRAQVDADADGACNPGAPSSGPAPGCTGTDNCPQDANPNQADFDSDHTGDTCDEDDDNDGVADGDESNCGGDPYDAGKKPERLDLPGDENGDGLTTDGLPSGAQNFDCDGDGYKGSIESHVFSVARDQDACGTDAWPSDFVSAGIPNSTNRITVTDLTSFLAPIRRLDTSVGAPGFSNRWDLMPGKGLFASDIAVNDLTALLAGSSGNPPMLQGVRAFNGPACPW